MLEQRIISFSVVMISPRLTMSPLTGTLGVSAQS